MGSWEEICQALLGCHHASLEAIKNFVLGTLFFNEEFKRHKHEGWSLLLKILAVGRGGCPEMFRRKVAPGRREGFVSGSEDGMTQPVQSTERRSMWSR